MSQKQYKINKTHKNNLDRFYEYRIYDTGYSSSFSEYARCPILIMSRHQGFKWNDELFVSEYRRIAGYKSYKSACLKYRDEQILSILNSLKGGTQQNKVPEVIDIHLTESDCDVWP